MIYLGRECGYELKICIAVSKHVKYKAGDMQISLART